MVGGALQGQWQLTALQAWQDQIKPGGVFGGEPARQQIVGGVIEVQLGLDARQVWPVIGKGQNRLLELQGIRNILSVVDNRIIPCRVEQAKIADAGFGAGV